jgi:excisionase family DNA binding protein
MSRTGKLVVVLQDQVEQLTVAIRSLERHLPAPLVSVQDAAERLGVSVNTVRRRVKSGDIPCTRIGKAVRIDLTKVRPLDQTEVSELAERALRRASRAK